MIRTCPKCGISTEKFSACGCDCCDTLGCDHRWYCRGDFHYQSDVSDAIEWLLKNQPVKMEVLIKAGEKLNELAIQKRL